MAYLLVVDDDDDFSNAITMVLSNAGHEVHTEADPESGLKSMRERPPDLAILDVMFPENSSAGFDLARAMRKEEKLQKVPILILSAVNTKFFLGFDSDDIDEDWLPVHDFLEKPMEFDKLKAKVNQLLEKNENKSLFKN